MSNSAYAWRIDKDHLGLGGVIAETGPAGARLDSAGSPTGYAHQHRFDLYDDDEIHYVTGTLYWDGGAEPDEIYCLGPLRDYGMGALGCTSIRYLGRPDWDC